LCGDDNQLANSVKRDFCPGGGHFCKWLISRGLQTKDFCTGHLVDMKNRDVDTKCPQNVHTMPAPKNIDWDAIKRAVIRGHTYREIGAQFGIDWSAIAKRSQRYGWRTGPAAAAVTQSVLRSPTVSAKIHDKVANEAGKALATGIAGIVATAVQQGRDIMNRAHMVAMSAESPADMKNATIAWGIAHQHLRTATGMDQPGRDRDAVVSMGPVIDVSTTSPQTVTGVNDVSGEQLNITPIVHPTSPQDQGVQGGVIDVPSVPPAGP
jgi:hypothetical protein